MANPVFDPSEPFENLDGGSLPAFDPSQPFESVNTPAPKSFSDRVQYAWEHATPGGPLWMAKEIAEGVTGAVEGSKAATAPQVGSEEDIARQRALAEAGPGQAMRAAQMLSPAAPGVEGVAGGAARAAAEAARPLTPGAPAQNSIGAAADRLSDTVGFPVDVPRAVASDSRAVQQGGQLAKALPFVGTRVHGAIGEMSDQLGRAADVTASNYGEGSGPNVARRIGESIEDQAAAEDAARQAARQREVDAANAQIDQFESAARGQANQAIGPALHPQDVGEVVTTRLMQGHREAQEAKRAAYREADERGDVQMDRAHVGTLQRDVQTGLDASGFALDPDLHKASTKMLAALSDIRNIPARGERPPAPLTQAPNASRAAQTAQDVADLRARYGPDVASAYERQQSQPQARSLLEFLAQQGGLGPDSELDAIGAGSHVVNVGGVGRRKLVRQGGLPLDTAREAAEEAGYLRGNHNATSTTNDLLDAIDAEIRGQPRYPEGFEGATTPRQAAAQAERSRAEQEAAASGAHNDLEAAGYGELGPDVRARAASLMSSRGLDADTAVETAFQQLEQEAGFPGNRPLGSTINMRGIHEKQKQLSFLARSATNDADREGARRIRNLFNDWVNSAVDNGLFSGSDEALQGYRRATALNRDWRERFGYNADDNAGRILNQIALGRKTAQDASNYLYGASQVGLKGDALRLFNRIMEATHNSDDVRQVIGGGIWQRLTGTAEGVTPKASDRIANDIYNLFNGSGRQLSEQVFSPEQRRVALVYADALRRAGEARNAVAARAKQPVDTGPMRELANAVLGKRGGKSDEQLFSAIDAYAGSRGPGNIKLLDGILKAIPDEEKRNLAGAMIRQLGKTTQTPNGFSTDAFATRWAKYTPEAKQRLFGDGQHRQALDDIALIAQREKEVGRRYGNPSGSAGHVAGYGLATYLFHQPLIAIGAMVSGYGVARLLSAPASARRLSTWARAAAALRDRTPERIASYGRASAALAASSRQIGVPLTNDALITMAQGRAVLPASRTQDHQSD
jgi:hypothetical protein